MGKKHAILLGAIGIAAVIIGGIFLLTPSRPMFGIFPEVKGEGVLGVYELWWSRENYFNVEVEVEGVLVDGASAIVSLPSRVLENRGPYPVVYHSGACLTQWVWGAENDYFVCVDCTDYEFPESFFMAHIRVRGIVKPTTFSDYDGLDGLPTPLWTWCISVEDAEYVSPPPQGYPIIR